MGLARSAGAVAVTFPAGVARERQDTLHSSLGLSEGDPERLCLLWIVLY